MGYSTFKLMGVVFEYGKPINLLDRKGIEEYLWSLWADYKDLWPQEIKANKSFSTNYQPFLSFDGNQAQANNFVGFINYEGVTIEIYPKVFQFMPVLNKELMHRHLFFWFSYCKKIKFPFNQSFLDSFEIDRLPELIVYLLSKQIHETVSAQPYSAYEEIEEALTTPRGRINFNRYTTSLSYGRYQFIDCDHEPFIYDNSLNRIIKYCVRLLKTQSNSQANQKLLDNIIFLLDEVEDHPCTLNQLNKIRLPNLFVEYEDVVQSCRMILENHIYSHSEYEMKNWSLLFPMEYIFEDFISGFLQENFSSDFYIEPQKSELYLHQKPNTFNLQHDILLTNKKSKEQIIIDTKYKPRWDLKASDNKQGVAQSDMYQMISYSYRRGTNKVILIYPNTSSKLSDDYIFNVQKENSNEEVKIKVIDVPFWSSKDYSMVRDDLYNKLNNVLHSDF
jgi:5-methylcytosine-specific restriction enzyme subunit McrC